MMACVLLTVGCTQKNNEAVATPAESKQAKAMLQGIWVDSETEEVVFRAKGDTIYYPDSLTVPAYFRIVNDSLQLSGQSYPIVKQAAHLLANNNMNISEVMYACGFNNSASFSTIFKKFYGISPREYMHKHADSNHEGEEE